MKRYSEHYVTTVDHNSAAGKKIIARLRAEVKLHNAIMKETGGRLKRVCLKGRLGKNNPKRDELFSYFRTKKLAPWANLYQTIPLGIAAHVDVYIYNRY